MRGRLRRNPHTYKYSEGVADGVVLDLVYEARDVDQELGSQDKIDAWFDAKTRGLNDWQKDELRKQWGTMQRVLSSRSRMERIVNDIVFDFGTKPRLSNERGTAMLVARSIFEASKYYALFQKTRLQGPLRRHHVLQSAGRRHHAGGYRRGQRDRQAVHLQPVS